MGKNIYVGNLPYNSTDEDLREVFEQYGPVKSARVITDRETGRSRGFGFVEMDDEAGDAAIEALNGSDMGGRALRVNEARPREPRPPRNW
jgi:RNA recognition motif-containing protein